MRNMYPLFFLVVEEDFSALNKSNDYEGEKSRENRFFMYDGDGDQVVMYLYTYTLSQVESSSCGIGCRYNMWACIMRSNSVVQRMLGLVCVVSYH